MASNIRVEQKWGGFFFDRDIEACKPTLMMHSVATIIVRSPTDVFQFSAERGVSVFDALRSLTGDSMPSCIFLVPGGVFEARISLPVRFVVSEDDMQLYAEVPSALRVHPSSFQPAENLASCIAVLTARGIFVLKRPWTDCG